MTGERRLAGLDRAALAAAAVVLLALGAIWAWDRTRPARTPVWDASAFVPLARPESLADGRERWLVAVQPACGACTRHLRWLAARIASRAAPPALGLLVVDERTRPSTPSVGMPAGVWWDSAGSWRRQWGRRRYGETYRFDASGRLLGMAPAGVLPDSTAVAP
jgi:hypothetical protein